VTPKSRKARALAAYVILTGAPVGRERLKGLLWGDRGDEQAAASLRQALYELRDVVAGPAPVLVVSRDQVAPGEGVDIDLAELSALTDAGELAARIGALAAGAEPLGDDLGGLTPEFDDWLAAERARLRERALAAGLAAGCRALAGGDGGGARRLADALERLDPLNEPAARLGLEADHGAGDLASLHRRYRRFEQRLAAELRATPAEETRALFARLTTASHPASVAANDDADSPAAFGSPRRDWRRFAWPVAAAAVLALVAGLLTLWAPWRSGPTGPTAAAPMVAVLPFVQDGARGGDAYFGAGVSEEIRDLLAHNPRLRVVGARTARLFGDEPDPLSAARRLSVAYVVEGRVRPAGERLVIEAQLIRASDGKALWSRRYDRPAEDVFAVQAELASSVAGQLGERLAGDANPHLATRPEVYDRFLEARSLARARRQSALVEADRLLSEAIRIDPGFAPAYASEAQVTMLLADHPSAYGDTPLDQSKARARTLAKRALELAPDLGDAYAAYGLMSLSDAESLPFYQRAVALEPQSADYHRWLGQSLTQVGRHREALAEFQRAVALEPLWGLCTEHLAGQLTFMGRKAESKAAIERFIRLSTDARSVERLQMNLLSEDDQMAAWIRMAEAAAHRLPGDRQALLEWAKGLAILGEDGRAAAIMPPVERVGRAAVARDGPALAAEAAREGVSFWDREPTYWDFAALLVQTGHGDELLQLYDARFRSAEEFSVQAGEEGPSQASPIIAAMQAAGRTAEAHALAELMLRRLDSDIAGGIAPQNLASVRAELLALEGRKAEALGALEQAAAVSWTNVSRVPYQPLARRPAFRSLAGEPRLAVVQARLLGAINAQRALLGLSPLRS
jgi:TolB-like protein/DNA-binding SARP family transcriptional activator